MSPLALFIIVVSSFAVFLTVHALECVVVAKDSPRWEGALAFVVFPLAPIFAARKHHPGWAAVWVIAALLYGISLVLAKTLPAT